MKRYISILLVVLMLLAAGCAKEPTPQPQEVELQAEGLWRAEDGAYLGIFANGAIIVFDETSAKQGQWSEEDGNVSAVFADCVLQGKYTAEESSLIYEHDGQGRLVAEGRTYVSVSDAEAFRNVASQIDVYQQSGAAAWMSQTEINMGYGAIYKLWDGLEQMLFVKFILTVDEQALWQEDEEAWKQMRQDEMDAARAEFEGGTVASMMASSCGIMLTVERVWTMLSMLDA